MAIGAMIDSRRRGLPRWSRSTRPESPSDEVRLAWMGKLRCPPRLTCCTGAREADLTVSLRQNGVGTGFVRADATLPKGHGALAVHLFRVSSGQLHKPENTDD